MSQLIPITTPDREFEDHTDTIVAVAVFPDRRRMVTGSYDGTLRLWDLKSGAMLKKMEGHHSQVLTLAVSRDGRLIASDGTVLATGSRDKTTKLWCTTTWQMQGNPFGFRNEVNCIRYSPSGELFAVATDNNIEIYKPGTRECVAKFKGHTASTVTGRATNISVAWTPDGTRLLSGGDNNDPSIREWDTSTWKQVGDPCTDTHIVTGIAMHPAGALVASTSDDHIRLWRLSDRRTIAIFHHLSLAVCVTFSMDGKHILGGCADGMISEWTVPEDALPEEAVMKPVSEAQVSVSKILTNMHMPVRNACISGDFTTAEESLTQEIDLNDDNYGAYANRSFVMARKNHWDHALDDAIKSVTIQPSLAGYISKGVALCGKGHVREARTAFDVAFMFTNEDSTIIHFLLLVKAITLFNADQHEDAILLVQHLAAACPNHDTLACRVVEAYLYVQLGINALSGARHNEAADYFIAAVNSSTFSSASDIHSTYGDLVVLFGWDLKSLWKNAHQKRCDALCLAGRFEEASKSYRDMMDIIDANTKARCLDWSTAFTQECSTPCLANGDVALAASDYDRAIDLYSAVINLNLAGGTIFANRSKARSHKMLWKDALLDAEKVIELNPSSHVGYQLKHTALYGAQRYDEAIKAFQTMLANLDSAHDMHIRKLREQYVSPSEAQGVIRKYIDIQLDTAPLRLINTTTGLSCDREAQISAFKTSTEYNELLLSLIMKHPDIQMEHITEVVATYFRCVMLSHRWGEKEPLLYDIKDKVVYELKEGGGLVKLQSFCKKAHHAGYHWAWVDSCCIDQNNNVELQKSLNAMFAWYRNSALTIVYLGDVPPSSKSGALSKSAWNTRGWTVPEFLAPKAVRFYQQDWTPYLSDNSPNHKESVEIMHELEDATGIDARALVAFQPGMRDAREKLQWASTRVTTVPEDIAYSLFGIFGIQLPILYGENKQNALGRLLQEIVARSGDITALDWVGEPSDFNSCLPADISSYAAPPRAFPLLSKDDIQTAVSSLRHTVAVNLASKLYDQLDNTSAPRFANCRLHLPCIAFRVTELKRGRGLAQETHLTYEVKADGLRDLLITTKKSLIQFTPAKPSLQTFWLVRPWNRYLLGLPDFAELSDVGDDTESEDDYWSAPGSPLDESHNDSPVEQELVDSGSHSRALQLLVRLGQPFTAFLLAQQRGGEYRRVASDHDIIAHVKDVASVRSVMDIRTLEIL